MSFVSNYTRYILKYLFAEYFKFIVINKIVEVGRGFKYIIKISLIENTINTNKTYNLI